MTGAGHWPYGCVETLTVPFSERRIFPLLFLVGFKVCMQHSKRLTGHGIIAGRKDTFYLPIMFLVMSEE